jgi:thymidylate synthase
MVVFDVLGTELSPFNKIETDSFINGWARLIQFICIHGISITFGSAEEPKKIKDTVQVIIFKGRAIQEILDGIIHPGFPFKNVWEYAEEFTRPYLEEYLKKPESKKFVYLYFERFVRYIIPKKYRGRINTVVRFLKNLFGYKNFCEEMEDQLVILKEKLRRQIESAVASNRDQIITWQVHKDMDSNSPPCLQRIWIRVYPNRRVDIHLDWRSRDAFSAYMVNLVGLIRMLHREVIFPNGCYIDRIIDYCDSSHVHEYDLEDARRIKIIDMVKMPVNPQLICREGYYCVYA